jgi:hypothetical protein
MSKPISTEFKRKNEAMDFESSQRPFEVVINLNNDEERNKTTSPGNTYDLTPFTPDEVEPQKDNDVDVDADVDANEHTKNSSQKEHQEDYQENIKKREEEGLLIGGHSEKQTARIAMYYNRIEDSDSDSEDEQDQDQEEQDGKTANDAYSGLDDGLEEGETSCSSEFDDAWCGNGLVSSVRSLQFNAERSTVQKGDYLGHADLLLGDCQRQESSASISELVDASPPTSMPQIEKVQKKDSFSNAVPLLKPPPVEKMQAYLVSKGLVSIPHASYLGDTRKFSAKFDDANENEHDYKIVDLAQGNEEGERPSKPAFGHDDKINHFFQEQTSNFEAFVAFGEGD